MTVVNSGSISATGHYPVFLSAGGSVTNAATAASISGGFDGVVVFNSAATVVNSGTSSVPAMTASIWIPAGRSSTPHGGVDRGWLSTLSWSSTALRRVVNSGSIAGAGNIGVYLGAGGAVTNAATASIKGAAAGIELHSGGTVTNAGTITGTGGTAIKFVGSVADRLVVKPGAVFSGKVAGSTNATNTLELASGGSAGTLTGLGTSFTNFGAVIVDSGAAWKVTGSMSGGAATVSGGAVLTMFRRHHRMARPPPSTAPAGPRRWSIPAASREPAPARHLSKSRRLGHQRGHGVDLGRF